MRTIIHKIKLTPSRSVVLTAFGATLLMGAIAVYVIRLERRITGERERQAAATRIEVDEHSLRAPSSDGLTLYLNASDVRAVANLEGVRYLATAGGLIAVDEGGNVKRRY